MHVAVRSPHVNNRAIPEHMGRVVGGGSSINATIWARPFKKDLDHWVDVTGDQGWGYEHALSIYRRMENWQGKPDARYRGQGGPVWCQAANNPSPLAPAMLEACTSLGLPVLDDLNGAREERDIGFALMNQIVRDGQRHSLAKAYLYPVLGQPNVTLLVNTHVDRLNLIGNTVEGVQIVRDGKPVKVKARREVILATGAINTPKLLMLSGIGDQQELKQHGIKTVVHSPEVGKNFQDHILHGACLWEASSQQELRNSGAEASGFMHSENGRTGAPDLNLVQIELPYARINFTGSTRVGRIIAQKAATQLKRCLLELGGKAPLVVLDDANIDQAVKAAAFGSFLYQGQICMSTERLVVDEKVADEFVQKYAARARDLPMGDPADGPGCVIGPMAHPENGARLNALIEDAVAKGARVVCGGSANGAVMPATILDHVTPTMRIYDEETFGPVTTVVRVQGTEEAIRVANDTEYGLSAAVFGRDAHRALQVAMRIDAGCVHVNGATVQNEAQAPYGGMKNSGYGRFDGRAVIDEFTELKWITLEPEDQQYPF